MARTGRPPVPRVTIECTRCGRPFVKRATEIGERNFCSQACQRAAGRPREGVHLACEACGGQFYVAQNRKETAKFCSNECAGTGRAVERKARTCRGCGKDFEVRPKSPVQHCSAACAGQAPVDRITSSCERCGNSFIHRSTEKRRFCSRDCFYADQTERAEGHLNQDGYRVISVNGKRVMEHRHVMEQFLGRKLLPGENVHHRRPHSKSDNRLENLELWVTSQPKGQRVPDIVEWCVEMLARYAPERLTDYGY